MFEIDIKYEAEDEPNGLSILDLRTQGFVEDPQAVVMKSPYDDSVFYILLKNGNGYRWFPLRVD